MRRLMLILILVLAACAPSVTGDISRDGELVTGTVTVTETLHLASMVFVGDELVAVSPDPIWVDSGIAYNLGTLLAGATESREVLGTDVACIITGYTDASSPLSYRIAPCE